MSARKLSDDAFNGFLALTAIGIAMAAAILMVALLVTLYLEMRA